MVMDANGDSPLRDYLVLDRHFGIRQRTTGWSRNS